MRGASSTTPLTVKQIADAHQSANGDKGAPFVVDGVETANVLRLLFRSLLFALFRRLIRGFLQIRLVGMVNGKAERTTDVSFTLDDGTGRLDFIRWSHHFHELIITCCSTFQSFFFSTLMKEKNNHFFVRKKYHVFSPVIALN